MKLSTRLVFASLAAALMAAPLLAQVPAASQSASVDDQAPPEATAGVRIVRLSQSRGDVKLDRNVNHGYEAAFLNLPIVQGARLRTDVGVAEVEFEDNSSLRLTPDTVVEFSRLGRDAAGNTVTTIHVVRGSIYVSLANSPGTTFLIDSGEGQLKLAPASHIQVQTAATGTVLAVYKGNVQAQVGSTITTVDPKKTLTFGAPGQPEPKLVSHLEKGPYDDWDKTAVDYHTRYMNSFSRAGSSLGGTGTPSYGGSDLGYYGSFMNAAGCGNLWQPYFASASWDPYSNGTFALYQGAGYSWVSPYPWGWMPYHSGSWEYCGARSGWGWNPTGSRFTGLANTHLLIHPKGGPVRVGPPHPPTTGAASLVAVNTRPLQPSQADSGRIVFRNDSAGLGVPRQTFGKLSGASARTEQHGSSTATVSSWSVASASGSSRGAAGGNSSSSGHAGSSSASASVSTSASSGFSSGSHGGGGSTGGGGGHH